MAQYFQIHPTHPQQRLVKRAVEIVRAGGVIVYPTDSSYALGCGLGEKRAMERIRRLRGVDEDHLFTLVCRDLSELSQHARVSNADYRVLRAHTPGPYTFVLPASREVPRRLQHPKRKTVGLRVPDHVVAQALLAEIGGPLMSSTLMFPGETVPPSDPREIRERLEHDVELVLDGGFCGLEPTTVVTLDDGRAAVAREGKGDPSPFQSV